MYTVTMAEDTKWRRWLRIGLRVALGGVALVVLITLVAVIDGWRAFGHKPDKERRARMEASPQWDDGHFENPQPVITDFGLSLERMFKKSKVASPEDPLPVVEPDPTLLAEASETGLRVTWLGHSTILLEIDGVFILTDPVWGERTSPLSFMGPKRWYGPLIELEELPPIDAVILSHDHYDHLDEPTISAIADWDTRFVAPLGVAAHLEYWGVPAESIDELDWGDSIDIGDLHLVMTPSRHASGRHVFDQNRTLWASYALLGPKHRVYFSGDTGLFPGLKGIGEAYGPFDLTMIEVGAYDMAWPDWHLGPEQAVKAHQLVNGKLMLPVHWGLFDLALHGWTEPIERVSVAAQASGVSVATPRPGETVEPEKGVPQERWWPDLEWQTAEEHPVVAGNVGTL